MNKIEKDSKGNIVMSFDGLSCIASAYSSKYRALKISLGYYSVNMLTKLILSIFSEEKQILIKFFGKETDNEIKNICFTYLGSKVVITKEMTKDEIKNKLLKL